LCEHRIGEVEFSIPSLLTRFNRFTCIVAVLLSLVHISTVVEGRQQSLAITPGVVILGIYFQNSSDEWWFLRRLFCEQKETAVMPGLRNCTESSSIRVSSAAGRGGKVPFEVTSEVEEARRKVRVSQQYFLKIIMQCANCESNVVIYG